MRQWLMLGGVLALGCTTILGLDKEYELAETGSSSGDVSSVGSSASTGGAGGVGECQAGYECVDPIPSGFTRYVRMYTGGGAGGEGTCPDGSTPETYFVGPAQTAECSACSCEFKDASCSSPEVSCYYGNILCGGAVDYKGDKSSNLDCIGNPGNLADFSSCMLTGEPDLLSKGSCTPSVTAIVGPLAWEGTVDICPIDVSGGGCSGGYVCVPKGAEDTNSLCIEIAAEMECPGGWNTMEVQAYEGGEDNRTCSACGCNVDTITCEGGYYVVYDGDDCSGAKVNIEAGACVDVGAYLDGDTGSFRPVPAMPSQGTCSGGQPMGKVDPTGPHKICCR